MFQLTTSLAAPLRRRANIWFVAAFVLGLILTVVLSRIDHWMYANNAELIDRDALIQTRAAANSLGARALDPRLNGNLEAARMSLTGGGAE